MLAICAADKPVVFKASKTSSKYESVSQGTKPGAQTGHKKPLTSLKQPSMSNKEAIKEDQQATGGPTSLRVTGEARANPQLSSGMLAFNLNRPIYSTSFIIHSESALGNDALAASTAEADSGNSAPSTSPHVLADQTKSVSEGLETILTQPITGKGASSVASQIEEETSSTIKLEDLAKLVARVQPSFKDLDSPEDDPVIVVNVSDEDVDYEVYAIKNSQKYKLELEKNKAEAEAALLKAQPSFPNVEQLKEILVKSLKTKFSNILSDHDFSNSLLTKLKDLPSKFKDLTKEVKGLKNQVQYSEIELPGDLKEIPLKLEDFTKIVTNLTSQVAKLKTLHPPKGSSQIEGEHIKKDKGKKVLSLEEAVKESTKSDSDDDETHLSGSMVESSWIKKVKKFDFVTEDGKHIHLTKEQINQQKKTEEEAKAEAAKRKSEVRKEELIDLLGPEVMVAAAQDTNNTTIKSIILAEKLTGSNFTNSYCNLRIVLKYEKKIKFVEQPTGPAPDPKTADPDAIDKYYETVNLEQKVACIMMPSMSPDIQRTLEKYNAYDMLKELKTMFEERAKQELFETVKAFHACKHEEERLGYAMPNELGVSLILNSLNKDYDQFIHNYNMHNMGKTIAELHAMLKLHEKGIPKKVETLVVLAIREGKIQKDKKKPRGTKGKDKGKNKLTYTPKPKIPPPPKRDNPKRDCVCHHCKKVGC
ncbi:hypothetical protein Tco_0371844 [Tanacetum coccineum]